MRLDLFLKASRLCPRRSLAQQLCETGLVSVNCKAAKPAHPVRLGDEIVIRRRDRLTKVRVRMVPETRSIARAEANSLYELLSEEVELDDLG